MLVKEKTDLQKSFSFNFYIENDYRKGSCPVAGGNALRQEKVWQKKIPPSRQELSTEPEEGEQQEPEQVVHRTQGLLQTIRTQPQQVGVCVEDRSG